MIDARVPITNASISTERRTWRRVAPSVRSVASSRVRWAIVIDRVLAITKLPTNRAIPPKASRKSWKMLRNPLVSLVACWACCWPVLTCALGPSSGLICVHDVLRRVAVLGRDADRVVLADLVEDPLSLGQREDRRSWRRRARRRPRSRRFRRSGNAGRARARRPRSRRRPCSSSCSRSTSRCRSHSRPVGKRAARQRERVEVLAGGRVAEGQAGRAAARDHLAVAADELGAVRDAARTPAPQTGAPAPAAAAKPAARASSASCRCCSTRSRSCR